MVQLGSGSVGMILEEGLKAMGIIVRIIVEFIDEVHIMLYFLSGEEIFAELDRNSFHKFLFKC